MEELKKKIREVPDFPKAGILFYDVTTLLKDADGLRQAVDLMVDPYVGAGIDKVGQVLSMRSSELLQIRNFGEKSLTELRERLTHMGLPLPQDEESAVVEETAAEPTDPEPEAVAVADGELAEEG